MHSRCSMSCLCLVFLLFNRCENIMTCPMREIGSGTEHCPYDWLAVYDGRDDHAPLIGKFCGVGKFPFSIIGNNIHCFSYFISVSCIPQRTPTTLYRIHTTTSFTYLSFLFLCAHFRFFFLHSFL